MKSVILKVSMVLQLFLAAQAVQAVPFDLAEAEIQRINEQRSFFGIIEAINQATITAQTSGRVIEIYADIDDYVEVGQLIMKLNDTKQKAALNAAQASLDEISVLLQDIETEFERTSEIYRQKLVSKAVYDKSKATSDATKARQKTVQATYDQARENLEYTLVRAPYAGIVMQRHVDVGEVASPGSPLITGLSLDKLRVVVWLPQRLAINVRGEAQVSVTTESGADLAISKLTLYPYADPKSHSVKSRIDVDAAGEKLYPGMYVNVSVKTGERVGIMVPVEAIIQRREVSAVYVMGEGNKVLLRQVRLGKQHGDYREILAGISAGELVAMDPIAAGVYLKEVMGGEQ